MIKPSKKKALLLLIAGLFVIAFSQLLSQYFEISDALKGISTGIGFGLMAVSLIAINNKLVRK